MKDREDGPASGLDLLLRQLALDPRATLLRLATLVPHRSPDAPTTCASQRDAGLTLTERELLQNHREELGELLRRAALELLLRDERGACISHKYDECHRPLRRLSDATAARKASGVECGNDVGSFDPELHSLVAALQVPRAWASLEPRALALASLRILPSDRARNVYVLALRTRGELRPALHTAHSMIKRSRAPLVQAWGWGAKGLIELSQRRLADALQSFRNVLRKTPFTGLAAMNLLGTALRAGNRSACEEAAEVLEEVFAGYPEEVQRFARDVRNQININRISIHLPTPQLADPDHMRYGALTQEVVRAFQ